MKSLTPPEFFAHVWPHNLLTNETLELRLRRRSDDTIKREFSDSVAEFLKKAFSYCKEFDVYFGVATRYGTNGGTKRDCYRVNTCWVDLDNIKIEDFKFRVPPSILVNSGGGVHAYWLRPTPYLVRGEDQRWVEIEKHNRSLTRNLKGDHNTCDITRVLRVPGTYNHKYNPPRKVEAYEIL
jgi:hypothetical protein